MDDYTDRLFTNLTGRDSVLNAFYLLSSEPCDAFLASPFFSNDGLVNELLKKQCRIRLIVRLGPGTDATALTNILKNEDVQIRYFASPFFHSKLYIFGQRGALVGSANLTDAGVVSNQSGFYECAAILAPIPLQRYTPNEKLGLFLSALLSPEC